MKHAVFLLSAFVLGSAQAQSVPACFTELPKGKWTSTLELDIPSGPRAAELDVEIYTTDGEPGGDGSVLHNYSVCAASAARSRSASFGNRPQLPFTSCIPLLSQDRDWEIRVPMKIDTTGQSPRRGQWSVRVGKDLPRTGAAKDQAAAFAKCASRGLGLGSVGGATHQGGRFIFNGL